MLWRFAQCGGQRAAANDRGPRLQLDQARRAGYVTERWTNTELRASLTIATGCSSPRWTTSAGAFNMEPGHDDAVMSSALVRKLLLDGGISLVSSVNRERRL